MHFVKTIFWSMFFGLGICGCGGANQVDGTIGQIGIEPLAEGGDSRARAAQAAGTIEDKYLEEIQLKSCEFYRQIDEEPEKMTGELGGMLAGESEEKLTWLRENLVTACPSVFVFVALEVAKKHPEETKDIIYRYRVESETAYFTEDEWPLYQVLAKDCRKRDIEFFPERGEYA